MDRDEDPKSNSTKIYEKKKKNRSYLSPMYVLHTLDTRDSRKEHEFHVINSSMFSPL